MEEVSLIRIPAHSIAKRVNNRQASFVATLPNVVGTEHLHPIEFLPRNWVAAFDFLPDFLFAELA
jgi:hypothetical protein